jgi:hypothetical protein
MRRRLATLLMALALASLGVAGAAHAASDNGGKPADKCAPSNGKAEGCPNHPDGGDDGGTDAPSCADLPDPQLAALCQQIVDALTGGGGGGEPPAAPTCADVPEPLGTVCQTIVDLLAGGGGTPPEIPPAGGPPECPAELAAVCNASPPEIPPAGGPPECPAELAEVCGVLSQLPPDLSTLPIPPA